VGGGRVLDPAPPRRPDEARLRLLDQDDPCTLLAGLVAAPVRVDALRRRALLAERELDEGLGALELTDGWAVSRTWLDGPRADARETLAARAGELDPGLPAATLLGREPWTPAVAPQLGLDARGGKLYLPGASPSAGGRGSELEQRLAENGLEPTPVE